MWLTSARDAVAWAIDAVTLVKGLDDGRQVSWLTSVHASMTSVMDGVTRVTVSMTLVNDAWTLVRRGARRSAFRMERRWLIFCVRGPAPHR